MGDITFSNLTTAQLVAMADGVASEDASLAGGIYSYALRGAAPRLRGPIQSRLGLLRVAGARTAEALKVHQVLNAHENVFVGDGIATWFKTLPFLEDEKFVSLAEKHASLLPISNWHWSLHTVAWAAKRALKLDGDFLELGVFRGHTTLFTAEYLDFGQYNRQWLLFDTFDGVPDDQLDPGWAETNTNLYRGTFSHDEVVERMSHIKNIKVIKGRVPDILAGNVGDQVAFIHVDLNNATAEIAALDYLYDRLVPGGVIVFDDYGWIVSRAQHEAEKVWFARRGLEILLLPTGQGLFVKPVGP